MRDELTTIGVFWSEFEAQLAKSRLEAAGIAAVLQGDAGVTMTWYLGNAEGIKLQVARRDVETAQACLADNAMDVAWEDAAEADTAGAAETSTGDEEETVVSARESSAERAWRGAILGLFFWPVQFYVFYLLVKVLVSEEPLRGRARRRAWLAAVINVPITAANCLLLGLLLFH